jgi:site-specific DNA recombinase
MQRELNAERIVVVYERVSSDKQDIGRQAVQRERAMAEYPDRERRVIPDDGVSAYKIPIFDRPGGKELCELIHAGKVEAIFADAQDRLSRGKQSEWWNFADLCEQNGTRIFIDGRELRLGDDGDEIRSAIDAIIARRESTEKSHRVAGGMRRMALDGRYLGSRRPYGYDLTGQRKERRLVLNTGEAATILRMVEWYEQGAGDSHIAGRLNDRSIPSPSGVQWEKSEVRNILVSPLIKGCVHRHGETFLGLHDEIVEPDRWKRLQEIRASRRGRGRRPDGGHVFTGGILRCPECHSALRARTTPKGYAYYACVGRDKKDRPVDCDQSSIDARLIERLILGGLLERVFDADETRARIEQTADDEQQRAARMLDEADRRLLATDRKRQRVQRDYLDGRLTAQLWSEASAALDNDRATAEAHARELQEAATAVRDEARNVEAQAEVVARLHALQQVIAGQPDHAEHVLAIREALHQAFERIYLTRELDGRLLVIPVPRHDAVVASGAEVELELELHDRTVIRGKRQEIRAQPLPDSLGNKRETTSALSAGTNALLKLGAAPLTAAADVLLAFGIEETAPAGRDALLDLLPAIADELVRRTGRAASEIAQALVELELTGAVSAHEGIYRVQ